MSALRSRYSAVLFANHPAMGVYGMLAGWLAIALPSLLTLCTTRPRAGRVVPGVLIHVREHLARAAVWRSLARPAPGELTR
jgi:hypothetical protein